jgi:UDP-glucuronate decarboxylase
LKILVTGSSGFIGTHLCKRLREMGETVIPWDFPDHDIRVPFDGFEEPLDRIYHLASNPSPVKYKKRLTETITTNVVGSLNILMLARSNKARVFLTSTTDASDPLPSDNPRACYIDSKKVAEDLFFTYHREYGVDIRVARLYSTYGPGMRLDDGRVIPEFILKALGDQEINVLGNGRQLDSFCYVDDMVDGLIKFMESKASLWANHLCHIMPIELGYSPATTIKNLALKVIELTGSSSLIIQSIDRGRFNDRTPEFWKAKELLNWQATTSLEEGLSRTIEYFREQVKQVAVVGF